MEENNNNSENKVVEEAKKLAKDEIKNVAKEAGKKLWAWAAPAIGWFVLIILAVGVANLIVYEVKAFFSGKTINSSANSTSADQVKSLVSTSSNGGYTLNENYSEQIIEEMEEGSIDVEEMGFITENGDNMIDKYIKVEMQTMLPRTGVSGDFDGIIKIQRLSADTGTVKELTYKKYDDYCEINDSSILDYFSLNPETFELCIATNQYTIYKDFDGNEITNMKTSSITKHEIEYQSSIQNYATPLNFLLTLHVIAQDVDFMNDVVDMALGENDPIVLTYVESSIIESTQKDYSGTDVITKTTTTKIDAPDTPDDPSTEDINEYDDNITVKTSKPVQESETEINNANIRDYEVTIDYHQKIETTNIGTLHVTKADTWLKKSEKKIEQISSPTAEFQESSRELFEEQYKTLPSETTTTTNTPTSSDSSSEEDDENEMTTTTVTIDKEQHIYIEEIISTKADSRAYTVVDSASEIKVDDFVEMIQESYPKVKNNLTTSPSNIFYLLQQNENTQKLEQIMRYIIYKLSGMDYGVTEADLEFLLNDSFIQYTATTNLSNYLRQFSHSTRAPRTPDGKYYLMYGDGVGWPTIGDADLQWKSHYDKFNISGKVFENGVEKEVPNIAEYVKGYLGSHDATYTDTEIYQMQIYIEKKIVDDIGSQVQQKYYQAVENAVDGLNLSKQQIFALVTIDYNFGSLPVRNGKTFKQTYEAGLELYKEGSWEHNRYIWDNWWCALGGGAPGHIPARDAAFETYVKGVFDFSKSDAGGVFSRGYYIYYTTEQLAKFDYAPQKQITRTAGNEQEIFTLEQSAGTYESNNSDSRVKGYYTSTSGRKFTVLNQNTISGWDKCCNRAAAAIIVSGYSDESPDELINTINLNKATYKWGSVPSDQYFEQYGLKLDKTISDYKTVSEYPALIRSQLKMGGYAMVWININDNSGNYFGKSGTKWTGLYHWVPILDYKVENGEEKMLIADWRGAGWYSINEFQYGLSEIVLISER